MPPLSIPLLYLLAASVCCYFGTHLLWGGTGGFRSGNPRLRGLIYALPLVMFSCYLAAYGNAYIGISILTTGAAVVLSLGLGVCSLSMPENMLLDLSPVKMLLPICLVVFLTGMSGELNLTHASLIAVVGAFSLWSNEPAKIAQPMQIHWPQLLIAILCFTGWLVILIFSTRDVEISVLQRITPIVVSLWILASVGLLVGDIHAQASENAVSMISGTVTGILGIGLPILIACGLYLPKYLLPDDAPSQVILSQPTWRVDCLLLAILSGLLFQGASRKSGIGRAEGVFLILVCLFFMFVTVWNVRA